VAKLSAIFYAEEIIPTCPTSQVISPSADDDGNISFRQKLALKVKHLNFFQKRKQKTWALFILND